MPSIQKIQNPILPLAMLTNQRKSIPKQISSLPAEAQCASINSVSTHPPIQFEHYESDDKDLGNGWYRMSPFLNGWVKVFETGRKIPQTAWMTVWVKEPASVFLAVPHEPVPKKSLIYKYISSKNPEKRKVMEQFEELMIKTFLSAKDFLGTNGLFCQTGIEITDKATKGDKEYFMSVKGMYGIEVTYPNVDAFLEVIKEGNEEKIQKCAAYFKGAFTHEMVHFIRNEFRDEHDDGHEIASHAIEILCSMGENPFRDETLELAIQPEHQDDSYNKDLLTALKVVQQKLIEYGYCDHVPQNHEPQEITKAIKSIDEDDRYKVMQNIASELLSMPYIDLLRAAAQVGVETPTEYEFEIPIEQ